MRLLTVKSPVLLICVFMHLTSHADSRPVLELKGTASTLKVDLGGGSISDFRLSGTDLNPLSWDSWQHGSGEGDPPNEPRPMGHFLCFDRWGSASDAEKANGMGNHGEATAVWWEVTDEIESGNGRIAVGMSADLPMAGMQVERELVLLENEAVFLVKETVTNSNPIGRIYNLVQHPSVGPPFLDERTIVNANASRGFMQEREMPNPEGVEVQFPQAFQRDGTEVDIRHHGADHNPAVVSYLVADEYGWVTAASPEQGLLIGYLWKRSEFPWLNLWRNSRDGKPYARGLEFGTSGLHRPGHELVAKGRIFDEALYRFIDASESQTFSYACFLQEIPADYSGVAAVSYDGNEITIREDGGEARIHTIATGPLFP